MTSFLVLLDTLKIANKLSDGVTVHVNFVEILIVYAGEMWFSRTPAYD